MPKIYNCEQGTKEWFECRDLHFTASNASAILAMGKGLKTLIHQMLTDHYSSGNYEEFTDTFTNRHIERGKEFEDKARKIYELETGNKVTQVGFVELNSYVGASPDGMVTEPNGDEGLLEIKCLSDKVFVELCETDKINKTHYNQMQMQMLVTGRKWCDYFVVNFNFKKCYRYYRVFADDETFDRLEKALKEATTILLNKKSKLDEIFKEKE